MPTTDPPRPAAATANYLTIDDALSLYAEAGTPAHLAGSSDFPLRIGTDFGKKYFSAEAIAHSKEVTPATNRDVPRPVATTIAA